MLLKGLNRFWTGRTYLVVVRQDERRRTRVPGTSYKSAFQIMQRKDATAKVVHYLPGGGGGGGEGIKKKEEKKKITQTI